MTISDTQQVLNCFEGCETGLTIPELKLRLKWKKSPAPFASNLVKRGLLIRTVPKGCSPNSRKSIYVRSYKPATTRQPGARRGQLAAAQQVSVSADTTIADVVNEMKQTMQNQRLISAAQQHLDDIADLESNFMHILKNYVKEESTMVYQHIDNGYDKAKELREISSALLKIAELAGAIGRIEDKTPDVWNHIN